MESVAVVVLLELADETIGETDTVSSKPKVLAKTRKWGTTLDSKLRTSAVESGVTRFRIS